MERAPLVLGEDLARIVQGNRKADGPTVDQFTILLDAADRAEERWRIAGAATSLVKHAYHYTVVVDRDYTFALNIRLGGPCERVNSVVPAPNLAVALSVGN